MHQTIGLCNTWIWNLPLMLSRSLLNCLQPAALLFQQISGWLKSPIRTRACDHDASCSWAKRPQQQVPPGEPPVVDPTHEVSFVGVVLDFYPQAQPVCSCFSEFTIHPFLNRECNTPAPSQSISSEKFVALHCSFPVVWLIPTRFHENNSNWNMVSSSSRCMHWGLGGHLFQTRFLQDIWNGVNTEFQKNCHLLH